MGLSVQASNSIIYLSYGAMLASGLGIAYHQIKKFRAKGISTSADFVSSNGSSTGVPLALNFIASGSYLFDKLLVAQRGCFLLQFLFQYLDNLNITHSVD